MAAGQLKPPFIHPSSAGRFLEGIEAQCRSEGYALTSYLGQELEKGCGTYNLVPDEDSNLLPLCGYPDEPSGSSELGVCRPLSIGLSCGKALETVVGSSGGSLNAIDADEVKLEQGAPFTYDEEEELAKWSQDQSAWPQIGQCNLNSQAYLVFIATSECIFHIYYVIQVRKCNFKNSQKTGKFCKR